MTDVAEVTSKPKAKPKQTVIIAYKGFDRDLKCRDFQYEVGQGEIVHIRASKVGENGIKANVWYVLNAAGEFGEANE